MTAFTMKWLVTIVAILLAVLGVVAQSPEKYNAVCDALRETEASIFSEDNICYFISETKLSWVGALNFCTRNLMLLAELSTEEAFKNITGRIKQKKQHGRYWMGLNDFDEEGIYTYVGSGKPIAYTTKPIKIKDTKGTRNCIAVKVSAENLFMYDDRCGRLHRFICGRTHCSCASLPEAAKITESAEYKDIEEEHISAADGKDEKGDAEGKDEKGE